MFAVEQLSPAEYAASRIALGEQVEKCGDVWWQRTKGLFYRPLLQHEPVPLRKPNLPKIGWGGFQCVVSDEREANASLGFLMLDGIHGYSLESLDHNRRRLIRNASKLFVVRPIIDSAEFAIGGFPAYASFYQRTGYQYKSERTRRDGYTRWAEAILDCPKAFILGGYSTSGSLEAVAVSYWVGPTLIYATFFSHSDALRRGVGEAMYHTLRESAAKIPAIREICVRRYQGGNGMDKYYQLRGAKLIMKPSKVSLHPVTKMVLKACFPQHYQGLGEGVDHREPEATPTT